MKSALLSTFCASNTLAPIEVAARNNCFAITYFLSCSSASQYLTTEIEKFIVFSTITFTLSFLINLKICVSKRNHFQITTFSNPQIKNIIYKISVLVWLLQKSVLLY